jgi:hypothetical protein
MREQLAQCEGRRVTVRATFSRFGKKNGWQGREIKTVLLTDLTDIHGRALCDHLWFTFNKQFEALDLQPGDRLELDGRSAAYVKGYQGRRGEWDGDLPEVSTDFKLRHPTRVRKLECRMKNAESETGQLVLL